MPAACIARPIGSGGLRQAADEIQTRIHQAAWRSCRGIRQWDFDVVVLQVWTTSKSLIGILSLDRRSNRISWFFLYILFILFLSFQFLLRFIIKGDKDPGATCGYALGSSRISWILPLGGTSFDFLMIDLSLIKNWTLKIK